MRQTVIALRLADLAGADQRDREATYYLGLMMNVYCHADAAEQALWFGDDISFKGDGVELLDMNTAQMISFILRRVGSHGSSAARAKRLAAFPVTGLKQMLAFLTTHSTLGGQFAERIGLDDAACVAIRQAYEQWDGKGYPRHLRGEQICLAARLVQLASPIEMRPARRTMLTSSAERPDARAASPARLATPREWPARYGDFMSTRSAIASRTPSSSDPATRGQSRGSASRTASQPDASPRLSSSSGACAQNRSATAGSNRVPRCLRAIAGPRPLQ